MPVVRANSSFAVYNDGSPFIVTVGTLYDSEDSIVRSRPTLFEPVGEHVENKPAQSHRIGQGAPVVSETTSEPGATRSVSEALAATRHPLATKPAKGK